AVGKWRGFKHIAQSARWTALFVRHFIATKSQQARLCWRPCSATRKRRGRMKLQVRYLVLAVAVVASTNWIAPVFAQPIYQEARDEFGITGPSIATSLPQHGDPYGVRKYLYDRGVAYNVIYTNDILGNTRGGIRRGTIDQGKLEGQLLVDLEKVAGWKDWTFYANAFGIYNSGRIRRDYVGGMNTIAAIEATPTV